MKNYFKSEIYGKGFFKRYLIFFIPILILSTIAQRSNDTMPMISSLASIAESYLTLLLGVAFFGYMIQFVLYKDKSFGFSGSVGEAAPKFLKWYLLTIITLGIYSPWYIKNLADYYLSRIEYQEKSGELLSRPGVLLKYMLLTLYLPMIVLSVLLVIFMYRNSWLDGSAVFSAVVGPVFLFVLIIFLALIPFMYFYFVWLLHVGFGIYITAFKKTLRETAALLIPQLLLSVITLFIYYPAACIKVLRYLLEGTEYSAESGVKGGFGFEGTAGRGFLLIWGQGLLTLITVGIYGPWAMAKLTNWFLNNTFIIEGETAN